MRYPECAELLEWDRRTEDVGLALQGGWQVRLLWCFPGLFDDLRFALPEETQQLLQRPPPKGIAEDLSTDFPYVSSSGSYTHPLVRMLAEAAALAIIHGVEDSTFQEFFGRAPSTTLASLRAA